MRIDDSEWRQLQKELRVLRRRLERSEKTRERLEIQNDRGVKLHRRVIAGLEETKTKLEESEGKAQQANRAKSEFVANMSHEIRTPMNGVIGIAQLLLNTNLDAPQRDAVMRLLDSADILMTIIDDILDFSKIEADKLEVERFAFSPRVVAERAATLMAPRADAKGLCLVVDIDSELPVATLGDPNRLSQVLTNLIDNAIKFTPRGSVVVTASRDGDHVEYRVSDTGIGIEKEAQMRVLEPFRQADGSTTRKYGGSGLGLAISARLVELMGGKLQLTSALDVGTEFHFRLPSPPSSPTPTPPSRALEGRVVGVRLRDRELHAVERILESEGAVVVDLRSSKPVDLFAAVVDRGWDEEAVLIDATVPVVEVGALGSDPSAGRTESAQRIFRPVLRGALVDALTRTDDEVSVRPTAKAAMTPRWSRAPHVLLAEDNAVNQLVIVEVLESLGCTVSAVEDGCAAVRAVEDEEFDLVLMDMQMPTMDGVEATRQIRNSNGGNPEIPIVALSANVGLEERQQCLSAGMNDFVPKPYKIRVIATQLVTHLPHLLTSRPEASRNAPPS